MTPELPKTAADIVPMVAQSFVTQTGGYFAVVGVLFLVFWVWGRERFAARKIQQKRRVDGKQLRHELAHTVGAVLVGTLNAAGVMVLYATGHTRLTTDVADVGGAAGVVLSVALLIAFNDLWFYAWHRLLHRPWWFRHVHAVHHKSVDTNPFSSYSFHPLEAFIFGAWFIPVAVLVPLYLPALGVIQAIGLANNVMSHLGYELLPRWFVKVPILKWSNTSTFHNVHHTHLNGNYGLHSRVWDRVFGTEVEGYEDAFTRRGAGGAE